MRKVLFAIAKNNLFYKTLFSLLLLVILIKPIFVLYQQRETFFYRGYSLQYQSLKDAYYSSQYVNKVNPGIIPDQTFEAFSAGAFLRGVNPILITHDQPPLGRYALALSIFIFDNVNTVMVLLYGSTLFGIFLLAKMTFKKSLLALVPVGVFANEPLSLNTLINTPLLEPIQLPFIIFAVYFFLRGIDRKNNYFRWFVLTALMLGFVISVRFFILGFFLLVAMLVYLVVDKQFNKRGLIFVATLPIALTVLFASYTRTIQDGGSFAHILGIQKYIYFYHQSQLTLPFSFWDLLLFNRWHTWWNDRAIIQDSQWIILWPMATFATALLFLLALLHKISISKTEKFILIWILLYSLFLSLGNTSVRYFSPLLPFLYIIALQLLLKLISRLRLI